MQRVLVPAYRLHRLWLVEPPAYYHTYTWIRLLVYPRIGAQNTVSRTLIVHAAPSHMLNVDSLLIELRMDEKLGWKVMMQVILWFYFVFCLFHVMPSAGSWGFSCHSNLLCKHSSRLLIGIFYPSLECSNLDSCMPRCFFAIETLSKKQKYANWVCIQPPISRTLQ